MIAVNPTVDPLDATRCEGQAERILARLQQGPATNVELAAISLKYTARISEVRKYLEEKGCELIAKRGLGGVFTYSIKYPDKQLTFFRTSP